MSNIHWILFKTKLSQRHYTNYNYKKITKRIQNALSTLKIHQLIIQVEHVRQIEKGWSDEEDTCEVIEELYMQTLDTVKQSVRHFSIHLFILINELVMHLIFE